MVLWHCIIVLLYNTTSLKIDCEWDWVFTHCFCDWSLSITWKWSEVSCSVRVHWARIDVFLSFKTVSQVCVQKFFSVVIGQWAHEFGSFGVWNFWSFKLCSPEWLLTRYAILCLSWVFAMNFEFDCDVKLWVVRSGTLPGYLYLYIGTSLHYFSPVCQGIGITQAPPYTL